MSSDSLSSASDALYLVVSGGTVTANGSVVAGSPDADLTAIGHLKEPAAEITVLDGGDIAIMLAGSGGVSRLIPAVQAGTTLSWQVTKIFAAGTTATKFLVSWR